MKAARILVVVILSCVLLPLACYSQNENSALRKDANQVKPRLARFSTASGDDDEEETEDDEDMRHPLNGLEDFEDSTTTLQDDSVYSPRHYTPRIETRAQMCGHGQAQCDNGQCYPFIKRCDGILDCSDSSDERECLCHPTEEWQCDLGACISRSLRCNGRADCPGLKDVSDEKSCHDEYVDMFDNTAIKAPDEKLLLLGDDWKAPKRRPPTYDENTTPYSISQPTDHSVGSKWKPRTRLPINFAPPFERVPQIPLTTIQQSWGTSDPHRPYPAYPPGPPEVAATSTPAPGPATTMKQISTMTTTRTSLPTTTASMVFNEICMPNRHFRCSSGQCIPRWQKCDRVPDCFDASDEKECISCDHRLHHTCANGQCISKELLCDGWNDCRDKSDEAHCRAPRCRANEFQCRDGLCIPQSARCDNRRDCRDGSDEGPSCPKSAGDTAVCKSGEFRCGDGNCIPDSKRCDRRRDCVAGEDERDCETDRSCAAREFKCPDGICIRQEQLCDGLSDCINGFDELNCKEHGQNENDLNYGPGDNRISRQKEHERRRHQEVQRRRAEEARRRQQLEEEEKNARQRAKEEKRRAEEAHKTRQHWERNERLQEEQEKRRQLEEQTRREQEATKWLESNLMEYANNLTDGSQKHGQCFPGEFSCKNRKQCVATERVCDRRMDCADGSDEVNCCGPDEHRCGDGVCLRRGRCDGKPDCSDGSDEGNCPDRKLCGASKFHCGEGQCIKDTLRCDGFYDCNNFADEQNCEFHHCEASQFKCQSGLCIARDEFCDGVPQCPDRSDEIECWRCHLSQFTCANGQCIERAHRCDGKIHCADNSDEAGCSVNDIDVRVYPSILNETVGHNAILRCRDEGPRRLKVHWARADGRPLKAGHTDVRGRLTLKNVFPEDAGVYLCVPTAADGEEIRGGQRSATLVVLPPSETRPVLVKNAKDDESQNSSSGCARNETMCENGQCIPSKYLCDGDYDCQDHSDEKNCAQQSECEPNEFQCANKKCFLKSFWCDGDDDCGDRTDEVDCKTVIVGSACSQREYQCTSQDQCIPRSFQCDAEFDCQDKSDEIGCGPPIIVTPPPKVLTASEGDTVNISCGAIGNPEPFISWRKNWGHIPSPPRVTSGSEKGVGILTIRDVSSSDQGAWTCEAMNARKNVLAVPDTILVVKARGLCQGSQFNDQAATAAECVDCFCFGVSSNCRSSNMYRVRLNTSVLSIHALERSRTEGYREVSSEYSPLHKAMLDRGVEHAIDGALIERLDDNHKLYWSVTQDLIGSRVASYAGYVRYSFKYQSNSTEPVDLDDFADIVMRGNGIEIYYRSGIQHLADQEYRVNVQLIAGSWQRRSSASSSTAASREDIMMVLADLNAFYIRCSYTKEFTRASIKHVEMDSASYLNPQGAAAHLVEQCTCPQGHVGHSCEQCAAGYVRRQIGAYLGACIQGVIPCHCNGHSNICDQTTGKCLNCQHNTSGAHCEKCKRGFYGHAHRGTAFDCRPCPCPPITVPPHCITGYPAEWFAPTCQLDEHNEVTCTACPIGYEGRRCEACAHGYERSDLDNTCRLSECELGQYQCGDGSCLSRRQRCDGKYDCEDFSDEQGCACTLNQYKCRDGVCVDASARCDGRADCLDMSDEQNCGAVRCNAAGSLSADPSPSTGLCQCKQLVSGISCDTCRSNSFYLHSDAPHGCIRCFCMGVTSVCISASFYRDQESLRFTTSSEGVQITDRQRSGSSSLNLSVEDARGELVYSANSGYASDVVYWQLPNRFLGKKISAYGGELIIKLRYEGSGLYREAEPDVILFGTRLVIHHRFEQRLPAVLAQERSVKMYEKSFVKADGRPASREELMLVLGDLQAVLVKASYVDDVELAALVEVTMDIAVAQNTGQNLSLPVERCRCPRGYRGLSCEDCDRGYTRSASGPYLGLCEPCFCNGHSSDCDLETGICRDCQHNTVGDFCEECTPGFVGDATGGTPTDCVDISEPSCQCHADGAESPDCDISEQCACKASVGGKNCQKCKEGSFHLERNNPEGCTPCFCFHVTSKCVSSTHYRSEIAMALADLDDPFQHTFQLTDRLQMQVITKGIVVDPASNSISFASFTSQETLFWSLSDQFLGNKLSAYGGHLNFTIQFSAETDGESLDDADIQISGSGITLFYVLHPPPNPSEAVNYSASFRESEWRHFDPEMSLPPAASTRQDLLRVLANLEVLLIRATYNSRTVHTFLQDVRLSTAVPEVTEGGLAREVEQCTCPPGYVGLSCEECAPGYIRELSLPHVIRCSRCQCNGHSESCDPKTGQCTSCRHNTAGNHCDRCDEGFYGDATLGTPEDCRPCPCPHMQKSNKFSETCFLDTDGQATCNACPSGYLGRYCELCAAGFSGNPLRLGDRCSPSEQHNKSLAAIRVRVHQPTVVRLMPGESAVLRCSVVGGATVPYPISWSREKGQLPARATNKAGVLTIVDVRLDDNGTYVCTAHATEADGQLTSSQEKAAIVVEGLELKYAPRVRIEPRFLEVNAGQPVVFRCIADGYPVPELRWEKSGDGIVSPDSTFTDGSFRLASARGSDQAEYFCSATNSAGSHKARAVLFVQGDDIGATQAPQVSVSPHNAELFKGENIWLRCSPLGHPAPNISWRFSNGLLPHNTQQAGAQLLIYNAQDHNKGSYSCVASNKYGTGSADAKVNIVNNRSVPVVHLQPEKQTVHEGEEVRMKCSASANPPATVSWTRIGANLTHRHVHTDDELIIKAVEASDGGMYVCTAENRKGTTQATGLLEVDRREAPQIDIYPEWIDPIEYGASLLLQCRVLSGIPNARIEWSRNDGVSLSTNIDMSVPGILRFNRFTESDAGAYVCSAENILGAVTASVLLQLKGVPPVQILQQNPYVAQTGDWIRLDCVAKDANAAKLIQWHKLHQAITTYSTQELHGAALSLTISRVAPSDAGFYVCKSVKDDREVQERIHVIVDSAPDGVPSLHLDRDVVSAQLGSPAELRCRLEGNDKNIRLEWNKLEGRPLMADGNLIVVEYGTIHFKAVTEDDAGLYECRALQDSRMLFSRVTVLTIVGPPRISVNPSEQSVHPGEDARVTCMAWGNPPLSLRWTREDAPMPPNAYISAGSQRLEVKGIRKIDAGQYICTAVNAAGQASAVAKIVVGEANPTKAGRRDEETVLLGGSIDLKCPSGGSVERHVEWAFEKQSLAPHAKVHRGALRITNATPQDAGKYVCTIKTEEGQVLGKDFVMLYVREANSIEVAIRASKEIILAGDTVDLLCHVTGTSQRPKVVWTRMGASFLPDNVLVAGNMLTIAGVRSENGGVYRCLVETAEGSFHSDYVFVIQIDVKHVLVGSAFEIICNSSLEQPVSYTWTKLPSGKLPQKARVREELLVLTAVTPEDAGTYICIAQNKPFRLEVSTHVVVTGSIPRFGQAPLSYLKLPPLADSYKKFDMQIRFRPDKEEGMLVYNGNEGHVETGDFISLGLTNGYLEFRFDIGSGAGLLRTALKASLNEWHVAKFGRYLREGYLQLDMEPQVRGTSRGLMTGLDLRAPLYLGGVPDFKRISKASGFTTGYIGCISELLIGNRSAPLHHAEQVGVGDCDTCALNPCANSGVCQPSPSATGYSCLCIPGFTGDNCQHTGEACYPGVCGEGVCVTRSQGGFDCFCPFGRSGLRCEKVVSILEPSFENDAYIAYRLPPRHKDSFNISLRIRPRKTDDALIIYSAQNENGQGDFVMLGIKNESVEFRFNTGSGMVLIRSREPLKPNEWVHIEAFTIAKIGQLVVKGERYTGTSKGNTKGLDLKLPLYVGGILKESVKLHSDVGVQQGFNGCVAHIEVNGNNLDLTTSVISAANIDDCGDRAPCSNLNPCLNEGICRARGAGSQDYECICRLGYGGPNCEQEDPVCEREKPCYNGAVCRVLNVTSYSCACPKGFGGKQCADILRFHQSARFTGDGWLQLDRGYLPHRDEETVKLSFSTTDRDGILLFHGQKPAIEAKLTDYLALVISEGFLLYTFDMGSGAAHIRPDVRVDDGELHTVQIWRTEKDGRLSLDGVEIRGSSSGTLVMLNTEGDIYLGGLPDARRMTAGRFDNNFKGCIHNVHIQGSSVLDLFEIAIDSVNVAECGRETLASNPPSSQGSPELE